MSKVLTKVSKWLPVLSFVGGVLITIGGYVYAYGGSVRDTATRLTAAEKKIEKLENMRDMLVEVRNDVRWLKEQKR